MSLYSLWHISQRRFVRASVFTLKLVLFMRFQSCHHFSYEFDIFFCLSLFPKHPLGVVKAALWSKQPNMCS